MAKAVQPKRYRWNFIGRAYDTAIDFIVDGMEIGDEEEIKADLMDSVVEPIKIQLKKGKLDVQAQNVVSEFVKVIETAPLTTKKKLPEKFEKYAEPAKNLKQIVTATAQDCKELSSKLGDEGRVKKIVARITKFFRDVGTFFRETLKLGKIAKMFTDVATKIKKQSLQIVAAVKKIQVRRKAKDIVKKGQIVKKTKAPKKTLGKFQTMLSNIRKKLPFGKSKNI